MTLRSRKWPLLNPGFPKFPGQWGACPRNPPIGDHEPTALELWENKLSLYQFYKKASDILYKERFQTNIKVRIYFNFRKNGP